MSSYVPDEYTANNATAHGWEYPMSDNELRDRIKRLVDETDDGDSAAKAIIDDLGLEWEQRLRTWDDMDGESRVVGKWERA